ncbi:hypothetical protein PV05_08414 [Exophiala xenobiotica]|uniref:GPI anchored serine-threonine rich protein n=1 Tax=Exophiala xenobiotica TaxID=348802 RepID=A0A0D2EYB2_9EURO|nr:uncharacterized protein PV05_08414 [Exophiala xenobiotica]KIW52794.1 hypothetical protein PV05_08414 [Exophiala xenobiotica]
MQLTSLLLASFASLVAAQTATSSASTSTTSSSCAAQNILDACKATIQGQVNSCSQTDYSCLCTQYGNLLTCYNNCPNDAGVFTVQQQREQNCNAASVYGTTTTLGTASATQTSASLTGSTESASETAIQTGFASSSETGADASASATGSSSTDNGAAGLEIGRCLIGVALAGLGLVL